MTTTTASTSATAPTRNEERARARCEQFARVPGFSEYARGELKRALERDASAFWNVNWRAFAQQLSPDEQRFLFLRFFVPWKPPPKPTHPLYDEIPSLSDVAELAARHNVDTTAETEARLKHVAAYRLSADYRRLWAALHERESALERLVDWRAAGALRSLRDAIYTYSVSPGGEQGSYLPLRVRWMLHGAVVPGLARLVRGRAFDPTDGGFVRWMHDIVDSADDAFMCRFLLEHLATLPADVRTAFWRRVDTRWGAGLQQHLARAHAFGVPCATLNTATTCRRRSNGGCRWKHDNDTAGGTCRSANECWRGLRVQKTVGKGGAGTVSQACLAGDAVPVGLEPGCKYAVKVVEFDRVKYRDDVGPWRDRMETEALLSRLMSDHQVGPRFFAHWICTNPETQTTSSYLVTDLWDGSLHDVGMRGERLSADVIDALQAKIDRMHRLGYVHADLLPKNVLVRRDARTGAVTDVAITDWGIAFAIGSYPRVRFDRLLPYYKRYYAEIRAYFDDNKIGVWDLFRDPRHADRAIVEALRKQYARQEAVASRATSSTAQRPGRKPKWWHLKSLFR